MIVSFPSGPRPEIITHSLAEKNRPRKTGRPSNEKNKSPKPEIFTHSLAEKIRPAKTKGCSAQALECPGPSNPYVLCHQYSFHGIHRTVFIWVGFPAGPEPEIITHSLAEKKQVRKNRPAE